MGTYRVRINRRVKKQLKEIVHYITNTLYNPIAAKNILMSIEKAIDSLEVFPYRNRIFDPIEFLGLYRHLIKKYAIYYYIDEDKKEVIIIGIHRDNWNVIGIL